MIGSILLFTERYFNYLLIGMLVLTVGYVLTGGLELYNDSDGYIDQSIIRLPAYALVLQLFYSESTSIPLLLFQSLSVCGAVYLLSMNVKKHLQLPAIVCLALAAVLLLPAVFGSRYANSVLSEALAYPLYLLVVHFFSLGFFRNQSKYIGYGSGVVFVLLLTRGQFLYLIPVALLLLGWISFQLKTFRSNSWLFIMIIAVPFLTSLTDKTYHKITNGHFVTTPWTGLHLLSPAVYVANRNDGALFLDTEAQHFFDAIYAKLDERALNIHHPDVVHIDQTEYYRFKYSRIANWTLYDYGKNVLLPNGTEDEKFIKLDTVTKQMAFPLIVKNWKAWLSLNLKNFNSGFGSSFVLLFYGIFFVFSSWMLFRKPSNTVKIIWLATTLTLLNMALVSIGMHTIKRFSFYNDWVFFLVLFLMLHLFWETAKGSEKV
ncbi:hypothetical protein [Cochleicola gelatinilyticus]|uniref:Glycosyltransferase RgtA/B/C/D-like domain-containing protein n=1 Tax=Cochleicola gelatinilyticus TaxID=1763537 RepID=A0A167KEL3_9FLAO|nr:hypothetical protein [Cochleicola gelatinilyticus]OAB81810.1 hypothetical protein ULVI_00280 [Cochleicola gelatinilyticus]